MPRVSRLSVAHLLHCAVITDVNVQPVRLVVHGHHATGLDDAMLLGKVLLCECLLRVSEGLNTLRPCGFCIRLTRERDRVRCAGWVAVGDVATYGLVVRLADRLAHQLRGPVVIAVLGLNAGDYEGHLGMSDRYKAAWEGSVEYCEY